MQINLFSIAYPITSLGPGKRIGIWVAGCRKRCRGCISPEMQSPAAGKLIHASDLMNHILKLDGPFDGVTISGGEPFIQAEALAEFVKALKDHHPDWTFIVYSGYRLATLRIKDDCQNLLKVTDMLIDGPYRQHIPSNHYLVGSGNQHVHNLNVNTTPTNASDNPPKANLALAVNGGHSMLIGVFDGDARRRYHSLLER